jgi:hypothetical protein
VPRIQIIATRERGSRPGKYDPVSWTANEGFEYWFPRISPTPSSSPGPSSESEGSGSGSREDQDPLIILGGGRESTAPQYESGVADDSEVNPVVGRALRGFLPALFAVSRSDDSNPGEQTSKCGEEEEGVRPSWEVEQEWTGIMGYTKIGDPFVSSPIPPPFLGSACRF